ncbi:hypothetical protein [Paramesorhizobium deserti]|uniref:hypothetical protein n=1 Tax=Paramesorhizobium deserti TaxID=1494590 RepID=UPI001FCD5172|nr:hypothetical protein [Paramesorhizobium deserti]
MTGAINKNPQRYRNRAEPLVTEPLGKPPKWLQAAEIDAWNDFASRLPWLNKSHRCITGIASVLSARMARGTLGVPGMQLLRQCLGQMCATPVSAAKVSMQQPEEVDDLLD